MLQLMNFFIHPTSTKKAASKQVLFAAILYFIFSPIFAFATYSLFDVVDPGSELPELKQRALPSLIYSAIIEELAFRLPINSKGKSLLLSSFAIALICAPYIIPSNKFTLHLIVVLGITIVAVIIENLILKHCSFPFSFYFYTGLFSIMHLLNVSSVSLSGTAIFFEILYCISKMFDGGLLGYVRTQTTVGVSILLHIAFNSSVFWGPELIGHLCNNIPIY